MLHHKRQLYRSGLAGRTLLLTVCLCLLLCYVVVDLQMTCYRNIGRNEAMEVLDGAPFGHYRPSTVETSTFPAQDASKSRRKLSSHRRSQQAQDDYDDKVAHSARRSVGLQRRQPQAIIIGVKKGGTRALLEYLRLHPDVKAPGPEPHFFDRYYYKGLDWYRKQMPPSYPHQLTIEKTPSYFVTPEVPARLHNMSRDIRLLVVVRDPVTRAISDYTQAVSKRHDAGTFEAMAFLNGTTGLVDTSWSAIKIGVYARHVERWLQYFPLKQFHFVSGERLISNPVLEMTKVQDFLGLKRYIGEKHFSFNSTKKFPCWWKSEDSVIPHCLGKTKGRSHPFIHPASVQRLRDFYRPFNMKFYRMVGQNFNWP